MIDVKKTKWWNLGVGLIASGTLLGCSADPGARPAAEPTAKEQAATLGGFDVNGKSGKLLHSLVKSGHLVQFVEMQPGIEAVVEIGALGDQPIVGPIADRTLSTVYQSLATDAVPAALTQADARRAARGIDNTVAPSERTASAHGAGQAYYNDGEQQWFRGAFCNGADVCVQAWDWAFTGSINGHNESFTGLVGSEGTTNASLWLEYWYHKDPTWPWACGDCGSWWQEFDRVIVVPGHFVTINVGGDYWLQGHLDGAGGGTQVSLSASHH